MHIAWQSVGNAWKEPISLSLQDEEVGRHHQDRTEGVPRGKMATGHLEAEWGEPGPGSLLEREVHKSLGPAAGPQPPPIWAHGGRHPGGG